MAKGIDLGSAKPDDPVYSSGLILGGTPFAPFKPTSASGRGGKLPEAPKRADFETQEAFEEATSYWHSHVGRIKGLAEKY